MNKYKGKIICKGSIYFRNGCGTCQKCIDELNNRIPPPPISQTKQNIEKEKLLKIFNDFFDWHREMGFASIKRDDFEEYLNSKSQTGS